MADVFICYARKHPIYADIIEQQIRINGYVPFRDVNDIPASQPWQQIIDDEIHVAAVLVAVLTEEAVASREVRREIELARKFNKPCIPLLMTSIPEIDVALRELGLSDLQAISFFRDGLSGSLKQFDDALRSNMDTWSPIRRRIDKLNHFSPLVRQKAVEELGATKDIRVLEFLVEAFDVEDDVRVKSAITHEMRNFDDQRAIDTVLKAGVFPPTFLRIRPYEVLEQMLASFPAVANYIVKALQQMTDKNLQLKTAAVLASQVNTSFGSSAFDLLISATSLNNERDIRSLALFGIYNSGHPNAKAVLMELESREQDQLLVQDIRGYIERLSSG